MSKTVSSIRVYRHKNGQERSQSFDANLYRGPVGARQAAMRHASIHHADGYAITVREYYAEGGSFDFVYPEHC